MLGSTALAGNMSEVGSGSDADANADVDKKDDEEIGSRVVKGETVLLL